MPIGKDSITKRVAKPAAPEANNAPAKETTPVQPTEKEKNIAPELVATTAAASAPKKAPAKKAASDKPASEKPASEKPATAKKPAAKKTAPKAVEADKPAVPETPAETPEVSTGVLSNISPETVAAVIGHKEDTKYEKIQIGHKMPDYLL